MPRNPSMPAKEMRERVRRESGGAKFRCDICQKDFTTAVSLIAHGQKVHGR